MRETSPMGSSAGRSAQNRTGRGARRRATPRERAAIDPPLDQIYLLDESEGPRTYRLTPRGERVVAFANWVMILAFISLFCFVLGVWFGAWVK